MSRIELVVTAESVAAAKKLLLELGFDKVTSSSLSPMTSSFIFLSDNGGKPLSDEQYEVIKKHDNIAILADNDSRERAKLVNEAIHPVEVKLHKLLLYVSNAIDGYYDHIRSSKRLKPYKDLHTISLKGRYDPVTAELDLGEMMSIFQLDISKAAKVMTMGDISELMRDAKDYDELKKNIEKSTDKRTFWDVIASELLVYHELTWGDVVEDLTILKEFRNRSAHNRVITAADLSKVVGIADALHKKLSLTVPLTRIELDAFRTLVGQINTSFIKDYVSNATLMSDAVKSINESQLKITSSSVQAALKNITGSQRTFQDAINAINGNSQSNIQAAIDSIYPSVGITPVSALSSLLDGKQLKSQLEKDIESNSGDDVAADTDAVNDTNSEDENPKKK